jgi:elongation factor Ts
LKKPAVIWKKLSLFSAKKARILPLKKATEYLVQALFSHMFTHQAPLARWLNLSAKLILWPKNEEFKTLARDIAMHITASNPEFLKDTDVTDTARAQAKQIFEGSEEFKNKIAGKPENIKAQIMEGKLKSHFQERTLLEQSFIKNPDITIAGLIESAIQKFGEKIDVARFVRFSVLEK